MEKTQLETEVGKIRQKLKRIYDDLEYNVTHTYGRQDLLLAIDLCFHSVIKFSFNEIKLQKGWVELLVVGDARCGKTQTLTNIIRHYRAGKLCTGENASFAGLIGGMQQIMGKTWSITWGLIPLNNRRLVGIDEVSGLHPQAIADMSGVRSEGVATITKIQREQTVARTRLIWMSNPRKPRPLRSYNAGVEAVAELIGRPEDIARFDFAITVASNEVPTDVINMRTDQREKIEHVYTSDRCHELIMWAWSRKPEDIEFTEGATTLCLKLAQEMGKTYHPSVPLVESAEMRVKLAKLATALATRLHASPDDVKVVVTEAHVQFIKEFLDQVYSKDSLAYDLYSRQKYAEETLKDSDQIKEKFDEIHPELADILLDGQYFSLQDFELLGNLDRIEAREFASFLLRKRCLKRARGSLLVKTPSFIQFLKTYRVTVLEEAKAEEAKKKKKPKAKKGEDDKKDYEKIGI